MPSLLLQSQAYDSCNSVQVTDLSMLAETAKILIKESAQPSEAVPPESTGTPSTAMDGQQQQQKPNFSFTLTLHEGAPLVPSTMTVMLESITDLTCLKTVLAKRLTLANTTTVSRKGTSRITIN